MVFEVIQFLWNRGILPVYLVPCRYFPGRSKYDVSGCNKLCICLLSMLPDRTIESLPYSIILPPSLLIVSNPLFPLLFLTVISEESRRTIDIFFLIHDNNLMKFHL